MGVVGTGRLGRALDVGEIGAGAQDHFDAGRSHCDIAMQCGVARRSVALLVERFESTGLSWPEANDMEEEALDAVLYPPLRRCPRMCGLEQGRGGASGGGGDVEAAVGGVAGGHSGGMAIRLGAGAFASGGVRAMMMRQVCARARRAEHMQSLVGAVPYRDTG